MKHISSYNETLITTYKSLTWCFEMYDKVLVTDLKDKYFFSEYSLFVKLVNPLFEAQQEV